MRRMKRGKAVGPDDIPVEAWREFGKAEVTLTITLRNIMQTEKIPDDWRYSTLIPTFKNKGGIQDCQNYRGIKVTSHTLKIWERVVDKRLRGRVQASE